MSARGLRSETWSVDNEVRHVSRAISQTLMASIDNDVTLNDRALPYDDATLPPGHGLARQYFLHLMTKHSGIADGHKSILQRSCRNIEKRLKEIRDAITTYRREKLSLLKGYPMAMTNKTESLSGAMLVRNEHFFRGIEKQIRLAARRVQELLLETYGELRKLEFRSRVYTRILHCNEDRQVRYWLGNIRWRQFLARVEHESGHLLCLTDIDAMRHYAQYHAAAAEVAAVLSPVFRRFRKRGEMNLISAGWEPDVVREKAAAVTTTARLEVGRIALVQRVDVSRLAGAIDVEPPPQRKGVVISELATDAASLTRLLTSIQYDLNVPVPAAAMPRPQQRRQRPRRGPGTGPPSSARKSARGPPSSRGSQRKSEGEKAKEKQEEEEEVEEAATLVPPETVALLPLFPAPLLLSYAAIEWLGNAALLPATTPSLTVLAGYAQPSPQQESGRNTVQGHVAKDGQVAVPTELKEANAAHGFDQEANVATRTAQTCVYYCIEERAVRLQQGLAGRPNPLSGSGNEGVYSLLLPCLVRARVILPCCCRYRRLP